MIYDGGRLQTAGRKWRFNCNSLIQVDIKGNDCNLLIKSQPFTVYKILRNDICLAICSNKRRNISFKFPKVLVSYKVISRNSIE